MGQNRAQRSQILKSRIILSKHAGYYVLSFAKRDLPDCMDLLKQLKYSNNWNILDMDKCRKDKYFLDKSYCVKNGVSNNWDIVDMDKFQQDTERVGIC